MDVDRISERTIANVETNQDLNKIAIMNRIDVNRISKKNIVNVEMI